MYRDDLARPGVDQLQFDQHNMLTTSPCHQINKLLLYECHAFVFNYFEPNMRQWPLFLHCIFSVVEEL